MSSFAEQALEKFCDKFYQQLIQSTSGSHGVTKEEMLRALQLPSGVSDAELHNTIGDVVRSCFESTEKVTVSVANRLFIQQDVEIKDGYKALVSKSYEAEAERVDYRTALEAARGRINEWVSEQTCGKIPELISQGQVNSSMSIVLVNALYFKGFWSTPFENYRTHESDFHLRNGMKKTVMMMNRQAKYPFEKLDDLDAMAVQIPFGFYQWHLLIVLPNQRDGLTTLLTRLQSTGLCSLLERDFASAELDLLLPRFKLDPMECCDVNSILRELGMNALFVPGLADLTGMCSNSAPTLSEVKHKAMLEIDEEGVVAAAATFGCVVGSCMEYNPPPVIEFRVDHPFVVALVHGGKLPVFVGHINNPDSH